MSGHSKWANIKHKKAREDAKRGKVFTKLTKEITIVAREGGGNPTGNARLRLLIEKAREANMPQDNIMRAIKKGTGELPGVTYEHCSYEGYGPHGVAIIVEVLTDNKNRSAAEMRHIFTSHGGSLGETGSVGWMFARLGVVKIENCTLSEDQLLEALIDFDIQDIQTDEQWCSIYCDPKSLDQIRQKVVSLGLKVESAEIEWVPKTTVSLAEAQAQKAYEFLSELDDHDDVNNVYANLV